MRIRVKLFGTLGQSFHDYNPEKGIEVDLPDGARGRDLLAHLGISKSKGGVISVEGRILRSDEKIQDGASVCVFQAVYGG